jgi:hypothetical protein
LLVLFIGPRQDLVFGQVRQPMDIAFSAMFRQQI